MTALTKRPGHRFEEDFFGVSSVDLHHHQFPRATDLNWNTLNVFCNDKFQYNVYGLYPHLPTTNMSQHLFYTVMAELPEKLKDKLRIYCVLGTETDRLGVDCILRLRGRNRQVMIDLTLNTSKVSSDEILVLQQRIFRFPAEFSRFVEQVVTRLLPHS